MWMTVCRWGSVGGERTGPALRERTEDFLLSVSKPDQPIPIHTDTGGVFTTTTTDLLIGIFCHSLIGSRHSLRNMQLTNHASPSLRPPDIAMGIDRDQMWRHSTRRTAANLILL